MIALRSVVDDPNITGKALLVAAALIRHADGAGRSYPGIDMLQIELGMSRSSILRGIAVLESEGRVDVVRQSGCVNRYQFICDTGLSVTPVYSGNGTRLPVTPDPSTCDTRPVSPVDPKIPNKLPTKLPKKKPNASGVEIPGKLDTATFRSKWAEWLEYRRTEHKPAVTAAGAKRQLATLAKAGTAAAIAAIDDAMCNGYQGLHPKQTGRPAPPRHHEMVAPDQKAAW